MFQVINNERSGPFFSVVIATYNRPKMLARALDSLVRQSFTDFEVVVVDDTSEFPLDLCSWEDKLEIHGYRNQKNSGVSATRNHAIKKSKGRWVVFLDDDDEWFPGLLESYFDLLKEKLENQVFSWCGLESIIELKDQPRKVAQRFPKKYYVTEEEVIYDTLRIGAGFGVVVSRSSLNEVGLFDTKLCVGEDVDLFLKLISRNIKPMPLCEIGVKRYVHSSSSLSQNLHLLFEHNIQARLVARHHETLRKYPRAWKLYSAGTMAFLLVNGAFDSASKFLKILIKIKDRNLITNLFLCALLVGWPFFWLYSLRPGAPRYESLSLDGYL